MTGSVDGDLRMNSNHWRVTLTGYCIIVADIIIGRVWERCGLYPIFAYKFHNIVLECILA